MTPVWSYFVIVLVVLNLAGCVWLIRWTAKRKPSDPKPSDLSHTWDGDVSEYNQPMPRWWINMFYLTVIFAVAYLVYFPGLGAFKGRGNWTSEAQLKQEQMDAQAAFEQANGQLAALSVEQLANTDSALAVGRGLFLDACAGCHGSSARGSLGFPDLTDGVWHWGGSTDQILHSITHGRQAQMTPWLSMLGREGVWDMVAHVKTLSGLAQSTAASKRAAERFGICAACHGADAKGNPSLGAPDLTDHYWLYGSSDEQLFASIAEGRNGMMPAQGERLGALRTRLVAAYVYALSARRAAFESKQDNAQRGHDSSAPLSGRADGKTGGSP
jgi:cytochrome c oxidase cbb3-type subunit 3